ncbi:hypothetical protein ACLOJK_009899 [Asimina triloba]
MQDCNQQQQKKKKKRVHVAESEPSIMPLTDTTAPQSPDGCFIFPVEEIVQYPLPGYVAPSSISFSPDDSLISYLFSPDGTLSRKAYCFDLAKRKQELIFSPPDGGLDESNLSAEEKLRRERMRERGLGVTRYEWVKSVVGSKKRLIMVPLPAGGFPASSLHLGVCSNLNLKERKAHYGRKSICAVILNFAQSILSHNLQWMRNFGILVAAGVARSFLGSGKLQPLADSVALSNTAKPGPQLGKSISWIRNWVILVPGKELESASSTITPPDVENNYTAIPVASCYPRSCIYMKDVSCSKPELKLPSSSCSPVIDPHLSPDGSMLAYVKDDELHVMNLSYGETKQLTSGARGNGKVRFLSVSSF